MLLYYCFVFATGFCCLVQAMSIGEVTTTVYPDKESGVITRSLTNAERFAAGMVPAFPAKLERAIPPRARKQASRTRMKRAAACSSGSPIIIPPHPVQVNPTVLFSGLVDDVSIPVNLDFSAKIFSSFTSTIYVSSNSLISLAANRNYGNTALPVAGESGQAIATVLPFWDDLYLEDNPLFFVTAQGDANSISIRFAVDFYAARGQVAPVLDFTVYYTTDSPGRWYVYYDLVDTVVSPDASGGSATIGAQSNADEGVFTQYSYNTAGTVYAGLRLAIDTNCAGSVTVG